MRKLGHAFRWDEITKNTSSVEEPKSTLEVMESKSRNTLLGPFCSSTWTEARGWGTAPSHQKPSKAETSGCCAVNCVRHFLSSFYSHHTHTNGAIAKEEEEEDPQTCLHSAQLLLHLPGVVDNSPVNG